MDAIVVIDGVVGVAAIAVITPGIGFALYTTF